MVLWNSIIYHISSPRMDMVSAWRMMSVQSAALASLAPSPRNALKRRVAQRHPVVPAWQVPGWWVRMLMPSESMVNQWWINGESHDSDSRLWLSWLWSWLIWFTTESMTESMTSHAGILWIFCQWESMGSLCKPGHGKVRHSEGQSLATSSPRVLEQQTHCMKQQGYVSSVSRVISLVVFTSNIYWHLHHR